MKLNNPFAAPDFDMQDIRGDQYGVWPPVRQILRGEALACFVLACVIYHVQAYSWGQFAAWFLLPDLAILVYVFANEKLGEIAYNLTHSTVAAAAAGIVGLLVGEGRWIQVSLIWFAHIGLDRALGYGLKFHLGFRVTHLGVLKGMQQKQ